jgi:lipopolysaccharide export system protein LptA
MFMLLPYRGTTRALIASTLTLAALTCATWAAHTSASAQPPPPSTLTPAPSQDPQSPEKIKEKGRLEVSSGALVIDDQRREAVFEGQVIARWGEWALRCDALTITYAEGEQVMAISARGAPLTLTWSGGVIEAARARLEPGPHPPADDPEGALQGGVLWLEGAPVLRRGRSALRGERVRVDLRSRQVKVEGVSGHLSPQDF